MITLETELSRIRGLSPGFIIKLAKLHITKVKDLLWHFPTRYEDFSSIVKIADLEPQQSVTVTGLIKKIDTRRAWKRKMTLVEAIIADESGGIKAIWFNQPYIARVLKEGMSANFAGKISNGKNGIYLSNPTYEPLKGVGEVKHTAGLIPVYPETRGLTSRGIRYLIKPLLTILPRIPDFLPETVRKEHKLPELNHALKTIHFPTKLTEVSTARKRFAFEDLFLLHLNNLKLRMKLAKEHAPSLSIKEGDYKTLINTLPFELTASQKRSIEEIFEDLKANKPMNRLLQGDVGSGKTVVAAIPAILAARLGKQAVFMAPTEVLAHQHHETLESIFGTLLKKWKLQTTLLTSGTTQKEKTAVLKKIANGTAPLIIGTHALIQKNVSFNNLAFVVIDEQHRFGVEQRAHLVSRKTNTEVSLPHFLSMSATPIPRTLSLTVFGDLDLSLINELPKGRKKIITKVVAPSNRKKAYAFIREHITKGRQAFVICPRIEKVDTSKTNSKSKDSKIKNNWDDVKTVIEEYEKLSNVIFPDLKIGMIHGKLKSTEKQSVMSAFKKGELDILVSTSVIEVGVDVPNATLMIIEGAERFGLAQLYQFRGRVGRGEHQSFCFLFTDSTSQSVKDRLQALIQAQNGFELAELDLQLRGPGEFLGDKQTGLPDLAMSALSDIELIRASRESAKRLLEKDAELTDHEPLLNKLSEFQKRIHLE